MAGPTSRQTARNQPYGNRRGPRAEPPEIEREPGRCEGRTRTLRSTRHVRREICAEHALDPVLIMKRMLTTTKRRGLTPTARTQSPTRLLGGLGASGAIIWLGTLIVLHLLRPDISFVRSYVSEHANGSYGLIFRTALLLHGLGNLALAVGLAVAYADSRSARRGAMLLGVAAFGILLGGGFSIDPPGAPPTIAGAIHSVVALTSFPIETGALLFFARAFRTNSTWGLFAGFTRLIAVAGLFCLPWLFGAVLFGGAVGLPERVGFLVFLSWNIPAGILLAIHGAPVTS